MNKCDLTFKGLCCVLGLGLMLFACKDEASNVEPTQTGVNKELVNVGFEGDWFGWTSTMPVAISNDAHSGNKSAKITGVDGRFNQQVVVVANTDYTLSAWVLGKGTVGVESNNLEVSENGGSTEWEEVIVNFNSGNNTTVTVYGTYDGETGRFDDFSLNESSDASVGAGIVQLGVASVSASVDDGNVAENTTDGNLNTRWAGLGDGANIIYDLGASKTISSLKVAWYKGNERNAYFKINAGATSSALTTVYDGSSSGSSGSTLDFETYEFDAVEAQFVQIIGFGNSSNAWNSITEVAIYGEDDGAPNTVPPGPVGNLSATKGDAQITLSWDNPSDSDFDHVEISYSNTSLITTASSYVIEGLTNGNSYDFELVAVDNAGNRSFSRSISATPDLPGTASVPSDLMENCKQWKITYPSGESDNSLCGEANNEYFFVNDDKDGIVFKVPIRNNNGTTPNSSYVRSELREMTADGSNNMYWTTAGNHVVYVKQAITHLPMNKDHLVATQIHGNKDDGIDDSMVLRLEEDHLFLSFNGGKLREDLTITRDYSLGTIHEVIFEVIDGKHYCYYSTDGNLKSSYASGNAAGYLIKDGGNDYVMNLSYGDAYFKVGNYTQSNPEREGSDTGNPDNYGEVVVYDFYVQH